MWIVHEPENLANLVKYRIEELSKMGIEGTNNYLLHE
jgi:hypothetical protein